MTRVVLRGWRPGLRKVSLTKLLQDEAGMSLGAAKAAVDRLLDGQHVSIEVRDAAQAKSLALRATELGAECDVSEGSPQTR